jgi:hypothetical protein
VPSEERVHGFGRSLGDVTSLPSGGFISNKTLGRHALLYIFFPIYTLSTTEQGRCISDIFGAMIVGRDYQEPGNKILR